MSASPVVIVGYVTTEVRSKKRAVEYITLGTRLFRIHQRIDDHNPQLRMFLATLRQLHRRTTRGYVQHVRHACRSDKTRLHRQHYLEHIIHQ